MDAIWALKKYGDLSLEDDFCVKIFLNFDSLLVATGFNDSLVILSEYYYWPLFQDYPNVYYTKMLLFSYNWGKKCLP